VPALRRVAIMGNVDYRGSELEMAEVETSAHTLGLETVRFEIRQAEDIAPAIDALKGRADALYDAGDTLVHTNRVTISNMALATRLPTISVTKALAEAGVLMSYGPNFSDSFGAPPITLTRFFVGRSLATFQSSSRPSSISLSI
jgi:putative ABC transport system substrate-binding protein